MYVGYTSSMSYVNHMSIALNQLKPNNFFRNI